MRPEWSQRTLADFRGKVVRLNIWATWCVPCGEEMPDLDRLQSRFGRRDPEVVGAVEGSWRAAVKGFCDEIDTQSLALYADPSHKPGTSSVSWGVPTVIDVISRYLPPLK